jgi:hypothetical protein
LFINSQLLPIETRAKLIPIDFHAGIWANKKEAWVMVCLARILNELQLFPLGHSRRRCRYGLSLLRDLARLKWVEIEHLR